MIVCVCNNISDREIRQAVDLGLSTMDELRRDLGVATCCGQCADCAVDVLNAHLETSVPATAQRTVQRTVQETQLSFRSAQAA